MKQYNAEYQRQYVKNNRIKINRIHRNYTRKLRLQVLAHYSNGSMACLKCGETREPCLAIDHINGDGAKHRKEIGTGSAKFYGWLKRNGYPDGFQVLCYNCNICKYKEKEIYEQGRTSRVLRARGFVSGLLSH